MAIILRGATRCPLCADVIGEGDDIVATSHFIGVDTDPLWRFSDAAMHRACFLGWPLRESFVSRYNTAVGPMTWGDGTYHHMQPDGTIVSRRRGDA